MTPEEEKLRTKRGDQLLEFFFAQPQDFAQTLALFEAYEKQTTIAELESEKADIQKKIDDINKKP